ncbi:hypothetical protein TBLA_0E00710 [Henningerozyma blattae CBS 6284]|uniref:Uncharacterized protein n=1 Tax=Henningerozyma blattae (strain ATCC 34711 / CBS 6284 / DSM 70876 / NBRC 10599 / NRRL Y-10934 / UCD 77-7) TaxID=1071380 RepID=I2H430_HENB6|nr:hypothetical protein TBLA_0E00710 [Tetrapisispora blattae CBS 6284]CCH61132.1 hypothetical protein TBLA_0E00710 [Tetrapisispora blattae CBS 6284]
MKSKALYFNNGSSRSNSNSSLSLNTLELKNKCHNQQIIIDIQNNVINDWKDKFSKQNIQLFDLKDHLTNINKQLNQLKTDWVNEHLTHRNEVYHTQYKKKRDASLLKFQDYYTEDSCVSSSENDPTNSLIDSLDESNENSIQQTNELFINDLFDGLSLEEKKYQTTPLQDNNNWLSQEWQKFNDISWLGPLYKLKKKIIITK